MVTKSSTLWHTEAQVNMFFPEGHVCCDLCPLLETYARKQCRRTGEYLLDTRGVGFDCPLVIKERNENG